MHVINSLDQVIHLLEYHDAMISKHNATGLSSNPKQQQSNYQVEHKHKAKLNKQKK